MTTLSRTVVRLPKGDKESLDRLRDRYFEETHRGISRAAVIRILVLRGLEGADERKATEVIPGHEIARTSPRNITPKPKAEEPREAP